MIIKQRKEIIFKSIPNNFKNKIYLIFKKFIIIIIVIYVIVIININNNKKDIKVCLCAIGKKENKYAKEFVEHYKNIGYNKIFIYDNNDIDGEKFEKVIKNEIDNGFVSIINYRGFRGTNNQPNFNAYKDCYKKNYLKFNWLSFFDFDEFLELIPNITIQDFVKNKRFDLCHTIKINWLIYENNNSLLFENKRLKERTNILPNYNSQANKHVKSIVRGKLWKNYWSKMVNPHSSLNKFITCSPSGKIIDSTSPFNYPPDYKNAFLRHYYIKSLEEYCMKIKRGFVDMSDKQSHEITNQIIKILYLKNKNDKNRLNIIKRIFNVSF